jgi:hypothetical protein
MNEQQVEELKIKAQQFIADLFKNHGIECEIKEEEIYFKNELISIFVQLSGKTAGEDIIMLQLDIIVEYGIGLHIVESFGGFGNSHEDALTDAFDGFTANSFHVILSAFFTQKFDSEIYRYSLNIDGREFEVIQSNLRSRGKVPEGLNGDFLRQLDVEIVKQKLPDGVHWVRLFYAQAKKQPQTLELLLDNTPWEKGIGAAQKFTWPSSEDFFSLRMFMIIKNGFSFERIAKIIASDIEYEEMHSRLSEMGLSQLDIEKAYSFIPEAFGVEFLKYIGIKGIFPTVIKALNAGNQEFKVDLSKEFYYTNALQLAKRLLKAGTVNSAQHLAMKSVAFGTVNKGMSQGAKLEDFNGAKLTQMFLIPSLNKTNVPEKTKPFWKFW